MIKALQAAKALPSFKCQSVVPALCGGFRIKSWAPLLEQLKGQGLAVVRNDSSSGAHLFPTSVLLSVSSSPSSCVSSFSYIPSAARCLEAPTASSALCATWFRIAEPLASLAHLDLDRAISASCELLLCCSSPCFLSIPVPRGSQG